MLRTQRRGCLFKSGEILSRQITQGPSRKTKITPGIKNRKSSVGNWLPR